MKAARALRHENVSLDLQKPLTVWRGQGQRRGLGVQQSTSTSAWADEEDPELWVLDEEEDPHANVVEGRGSGRVGMELQEDCVGEGTQKENWDEEAVDEMILPSSHGGMRMFSPLSPSTLV